MPLNPLPDGVVNVVGVVCRAGSFTAGDGPNGCRPTGTTRCSMAVPAAGALAGVTGPLCPATLSKTDKDSMSAAVAPRGQRQAIATTVRTTQPAEFMGSS